MYWELMVSSGERILMHASNPDWKGPLPNRSQGKILPREKKVFEKLFVKHTLEAANPHLISSQLLKYLHGKQAKRNGSSHVDMWFMMVKIPLLDALALANALSKFGRPFTSTL